MLSYKEEQELVQKEADKFPKEFGLKAFPGDVFSVSVGASYYSRGYDNECGCQPAQVLLYTYIKREDGTWGAFAKGSSAELRREVVEL